MAALAARLKDGIRSQLDGVVLNGPENDAQRFIGNVNLSFSYVEGESLIMGLKVRTCPVGRLVGSILSFEESSLGSKPVL